jgi:uncharacterized protein
MTIFRLFLLTVFAALGHAAQAASFDCAKASTLIENAICASPDLSRKDEALGRLYQSALKQNPAVRTEQVNWLRERNRCIDERCLNNAYDRRIDELRAVSGATASGSAPPQNLATENSVAPSPSTRAEKRPADPVRADPARTARELQMPGVSRCIAATVVMSAGLAQDPKIKANGPEIRNNSSLLEFYGDARKSLLRSMNNPAAEGALDNMVRQQGEYFGNMVRFQGWNAFLPVYKECRDRAYQ